MKPQITLILLLITLGITACAQSNTYKITGQIDNIADGGIVHLFTVEGIAGRLFKSDTIRNGSFSFEGNVDSLQMLRLMVFDENFPGTTLPLWIVPGVKTRITGNAYHLSVWDIKSNVKEQQEEEIYRNAVKDFASKYDSVDLIYRQIDRKIKQAENEEQKQKYRTEIRAVQKELINLSFSYQREILDVMVLQPVTESWINRLALFAGFTNTAVGPTSYPEENIKVLQQLYNRLTDEQKQSRKGQAIYANIFPFKKTEEGDPMAKGRFFDPQGNEHEITDFANKGKHILLDFWGVGCAPCVAAFPEMKEIHETHQDKLTIISISTDTHDVWQEGLKKHQLPWVNLNDFLILDGYPAHYGVYAIPFYILISPDGIVDKIWSGYGKGSLKEKLKDVL
jgi:thiol-disulfide isomerase/thioredoxin